VGGAGQETVAFLPGLSRRHEDHPVEAGLIEGRFAGVEMSQMDRIEGPAEDAGAHDAEDRGQEESPTGGRG